MRIREKNLLHLPVFTQSGKGLGKVVGFDLNTETHVVTTYYIKTHRLLSRPFGSELVVAPSQVIKITKEKMVVEDLWIGGEEGSVPPPPLMKQKIAPPISPSISSTLLDQSYKDNP